MYKLTQNPAEVARYLGFQGAKPDPETATILAEMEQTLLQVARPRVTHQVYPLAGTHLVNTTLTLTGQDITDLLQTCHSCILLAVTLGQEVDTLLRRLQITDLSRGLVADVCASSLVEGLCDQVYRQLKEQWQNQGDFLTSRYSPGYGDLPIETQGNLCRVLNTQGTIGLSPTATHILTPRKSITAVVGISHQRQTHRPEGCASCTLAPHCQYTKGGLTCA